MGVTTTVLVIIAGTISFDYVNRRHPGSSVDRHTGKDTPAQAGPAPVTPPGACVDGDGAWKNWSYPNVPMLSPKCETK